MENIFDKFKKLNLDTSPIGLSIELREPFFCTPIGAQIIGWDNGIHYCFIKGFKEIVFCVNPETCCNYYVYPLATVYKGNIIKNLIMDCQSYTKYRPNETTGGIFVSWRRKEELPTGA